MSGEASAKRQKPPESSWADYSIADLDDEQLESTACAAFAWFRSTLKSGAAVVDPASFDRLVELQCEYLRRFPAGDLSASATLLRSGMSSPVSGNRAFETASTTDETHLA